MSLRKKKKIEEEVKEEVIEEQPEEIEVEEPEVEIEGGDIEETDELVIEDNEEPEVSSEFRVGNKVTLKAMVDYNGRKLEDVEDEVYTIYAIEGDKVQLRYGNLIFFVKITNLNKE